MDDEQVVVFRPYPLQAGQKIRIEGGRRHGDWLVIKVSEGKVTLRCPVSLREVTWDRFYFYAEERRGPWPLTD